MVNILVVRDKNNQLGDTICALPMFYALKKKFPQSKITLLHGAVNYEIKYKELNPYIDDVLLFDRYSSFTEKKHLIRTLRGKKFDYAIIPSTFGLSTTGHLINYLSGAKKRVGLSYYNDKKNALEFLLNIKKGFDWDKRKISQAMRGLEIVEQIGCSIAQNEIDSIGLEVDAKNIKFADDFIKNNFDKERILIGIHPGGKTMNRWPAENFTAVLEELSREKNAEFLITSGEIDKDITDKLSNILAEKKIKFAVAQSLPVKDLSALMRKLSLYISNDTGILHLASLNKVRTIGLFGPTDSTEWKPIGKETICIQSPTVDMKDLKPLVVLDAAKKILDGG
jgi:ADP-heptose:LPS heptosyltransferase